MTPAEGRMLAISERSLRVLFDMAQKADEAMLLGTCSQSPDPYCGPCWAMSEAQEVLRD